MNAGTVQNQPAPVESAVRNLRVCRGYMLGCCSALDVAGEREAHHALLLSLAQLDDCIAELEKPEPPTKILASHMDDVFHTRETLADDRRMDRSMDREDH